MWQYLLTTLAVLLLIPILSIVFKIVSNKRSLKFYENQGLKTFFFALKGPFGFYSEDIPENKKVSNLEYVHKIMHGDPQAPGMAVNNFHDGRASVVLYNPEYIKEFLLKEDKFCKVAMEGSTAGLVGLILKDGQEAIHQRGIVNEVFHFQALANFVPDICSITHEIFKGYCSKLGVNADGYTRINLNDMFDPVFEQMLNVLVFGTREVGLLSNGLIPYRSIVNWFLQVPVMRKHPLYNLMPWICQKVNILESTRLIWKSNEYMLEYVARLYEERSKKDELGKSVLDNCIRHNKRCEKEGSIKDMLSMQDIVGNINIFVFAGTDTSQNASKMSICHLASHPDHIQLLQDISDRIYTQDSMTTTSAKLNDEPTLNLWMKETLRVNAPSGRSLPRRANEDVLIKDLTIKKGDQVFVFTHALRMAKHHFDDPEVFKLDRFSKPMNKDIERYAYNPFWQGKRACIGKNLGEVMILILVTQFCKMFCFKKPEDVQYYKKIIFMVTENNPWVDVRLRLPK